jgi:hypothetical protein
LFSQTFSNSEFVLRWGLFLGGAATRRNTAEMRCNEGGTPLEIDTTQVMLFRSCCDFSPLRGHVPPIKATERYRAVMEQLIKELGDVLGVPLAGFWSAVEGTGPRCCTTA